MLSLSIYEQVNAKSFTEKFTLSQGDHTKNDDDDDPDDESNTDAGVSTRKRNSVKQQEKPYVILISSDGFRHDYVKKYKANHLKKLSNSGSSAE